MKRNNILRYMFGISVAAGLTSSVVKSFGRKKTVSTVTKLDPFIGEWVIMNPETSVAMDLWITADENIYLNEQSLKGKITVVNNHQLIFTDRFGYELTVTIHDNGTYTLYDEADEKEYTLVRRSA